VGARARGVHAIVVSRQIWQKVICWVHLALWLLIQAFGTGARGFTGFHRPAGHHPGVPQTHHQRRRMLLRR
jgi:hypothetical protein